MSSTGFLVGLELASVLPYLSLLSDDKQQIKTWWHELQYIVAGVQQAHAANNKANS